MAFNEVSIAWLISEGWIIVGAPLNQNFCYYMPLKSEHKFLK